MINLTKYSRSVRRGVYSCGAVVANCLYLLTEPANDPDIMLCLLLCKQDGSGSSVTKVGLCLADSGYVLHFCPHTIFTVGQSKRVEVALEENKELHVLVKSKFL